MIASVKLTTFSYRFADEVLNSPAFVQQRADIEGILEKFVVPQLAKPKVRRRKNKKTGLVIKEMIFTTDQQRMNDMLDEEFEAKEWDCQPPVTADKVTGIKADYKKKRVQVEVQFGNMARWTYDVFKFQVSYSLGLIDVGVLIVPMQAFASTVDENIAYYERVVRELPYAKMSITLPILVIGVSP